MSGSRIAIIPKRTLDFSALRTSTTEDVVLAERVSVVPWRQAALITRVHLNGIASGAGSVEILTVPESWTDEEPSVTFLETTLTTVATINSAVATPSLQSVSLQTGATHGFAEAIRIIARGTRTAPGTIRVDVTVELDVKA